MTVRSVRRRARLVVALALGFAAVAGAAEQVVIEDWSRPAATTRGVPPEWKGQNWGSPKYDFAIEVDDGHKVLHLRSANEGSTISRDIKGKVDLRQTPLLEWSWKATVLPRGGHSCHKATDDQAIQLFVVWPRFPEAVRSRIIGYVWDTTAPVGTICKSEKTGTVTYVVVRSGPSDLGKWLTERRDVVQDFKQIYGEAPEAPAALSVAIDSNDTNSTAESFVGNIRFRSP